MTSLLISLLVVLAGSHCIPFERPVYPQICRSSFDCLGAHQVCVLTVSGFFGHCFIRANTGQKKQTDSPGNVDRLVKKLDKMAAAAESNRRRKRGINDKEIPVEFASIRSRRRKLNHRRIK